MCHLEVGAEPCWSYLPHDKHLPWRSPITCTFPSLLVLQPWDGFPKGFAFVLAANLILLLHSPLGLRLLLSPLLLLVPPLPPRVLCWKYNSAPADPVTKTQVICLRSTLHTQRHG